MKSCYFIFFFWSDTDCLNAVIRLLFIFRIFSFVLSLFCNGPLWALEIPLFFLEAWFQYHALHSVPLKIQCKVRSRFPAEFLPSWSSHSKTAYIFLNIIAYFFHVFTWGHIKNVLDSFLFSNTVNYIPDSIFIIFHPSLLSTCSLSFSLSASDEHSPHLLSSFLLGWVSIRREKREYLLCCLFSKFLCIESLSCARNQPKCLVIMITKTEMAPLYCDTA